MLFLKDRADSIACKGDPYEQKPGQGSLSLLGILLYDEEQADDHQHDADDLP